MNKGNMNIFKNKKNLIILAVIVVILVIYLIYISLSSTNSPQNNAINSNSAASHTATKTAEVQMIKKTSGKVFYPYFYDNNIIYISENDSCFYRYNITTQITEKIIDQSVLGITEIQYSPDGKKAIVKSDYPSYNVKIYNFEEKSVKDEGSQILDFVWNENGSKIAYLYNDKMGNIKTCVSDSNFNAWQEIISIDSKLYAVDLYQFTKSNIYYGKTNSIDITDSLFSLDINTKKESEFENSKQFYNYLFSPNGDKVILTFLDNNGNEIYKILNLKNSEITDLNLVLEKNGAVDWKNNDTLLIYVNNGTSEEIQEIDINQKKITSLYKLDNPEKMYTNITKLLLHSSSKRLFLLSNNDYIYNLNLN